MSFPAQYKKIPLYTDNLTGCQCKTIAHPQPDVANVGSGQQQRGISYKF